MMTLSPKPLVDAAAPLRLCTDANPAAGSAADGGEQGGRGGGGDLVIRTSRCCRRRMPHGSRVCRWGAGQTGPSIRSHRMNPQHRSSVTLTGSPAA